MAKLSRRARRWLGLPAGLVVGALVAALAGTSLLSRLEARSQDVRWQLTGQRPLDDRVVVVDVDDEALELLGWPVPRGFYAQLIQIAKKHGARAIGFDVLFLEPSDAANDELLAKAARECACVIFPSQLSPDPASPGAMKAERPIEVLAAASAAVAHVQLDNTLDGVFRTAPLSLSDDAGKPVPALSLALARLAGAPPANIPDTTGARAWINWRSTQSGSVRAIPFFAVLAAEAALANGEKPELDLDARFKDAIVIVGQSAKSVGDRGPLPMTADAPLVLAHANLVDNLTRDRLLSPPPFALVLLLSLLVAGFVGLAVTSQRALAGVAGTVGVVLVAWSAATLAWRAELWLPLAAPMTGAALSFVVGSVLNAWGRDAEEKKLRAAFERYVAPHILDKILTNADGVDIRGHRRTLTLLFSDIKGYTTLSNTLAPDEIVELLCTYLDTMVDILLVHEGTVDKIMGDGIMAFFGDPLPQEDHALRCIKASLAMQKATAKLGEKWVARGLSPLQVRIGVATGEVFVGSIGSRQHLEYTAIGRPVNLAARLEGKAPPGGVLISAETFALVKDHVEAREVRGLDLKGYSAGYDAWLVTGMKGEPATDGARLEQRTAQRQMFFSDVTLTFQGVDLHARSSDISPGGMFVHCDVLPPRGSTVKVRASLTSGAGNPSAIAVAMDAVVTHVREGKPGSDGVGLMFTTVFADDRRAIQALLEGIIGDDVWDEKRLVEPAAGSTTYAYPLDPNVGPPLAAPSVTADED